MVEVRVARLAKDATADAFVVILQEEGGERMLPIWIGRAEAESIARHLEGAPTGRPMTHDLACDLIRVLGGRLERADITHVVESTFFSTLTIRTDTGAIEVDARPSDAISLALRFGATIRAAEPLLAHYPVLLDDPATADAAAGEGSGDEPTDPPAAFDTPPAQVERQPSDLQRYLEQMRPEDFGKFRL